MALGKGTKLYLGTGNNLAGATFTKANAIVNLKSIGEQTTSTDEIETTNLGSGDYKEFEPTQKDNGSIQITGDLDGVNYTKFKGKQGELMPFAIANADDTEVNGKFMGWISELSRGEITPSEKITFSATIRISGKIIDFTEPTI